jgi:sulfatase maturation enzyme AslB (radical SAM superfamily)
MDQPDLTQLEQFVQSYDYPTDILVETVAHCNLKCVMCPQKNLTRPRGRMSYELWKKIVDEVAEASPSTTIWAALMGEPLVMAPEIFRWLRYAKHAGIERIALNSNLNLLRPDHAESLVTSGVDELIVGLDAASCDLYREIRVEGNLERVRRAIEYLADTKERLASRTPKLVLQFIVMDENAHEEQAFIDYWQQAGHEVDLKIKPRTGWGGTVPVWSGMQPGKQGKRLPCTWLLRQLTVFWNGQVPQCDGDWNGRTRYGNLNRQSINEVWNGPLARVRAKHFRGDYKFVPCHDCQDWSAGLSRTIHCGQPAAAARES